MFVGGSQDVCGPLQLLIAKLPELSIRILDHARDHGRVTIADAVVLTGASRNTMKPHFKALRKRRLLVLHGQDREAWYSMP
jgi:Fic family protein